jgi:hypothetical protein
MNYKRLHEIDDELQRMIDDPQDATIEDYTRLQREKSALLLAAEAEKAMRDPKEAIRRNAAIKMVTARIGSNLND